MLRLVLELGLDLGLVLGLRVGLEAVFGLGVKTCEVWEIKLVIGLGFCLYNAMANTWFSGLIRLEAG